MDIVKILKNGGIGVLATDTIYGLVGHALLPDTVARIYRVRRRNLQKPFVILIAGFKDLKLFDIELTSKQKQKLKQLWPGHISVILPCLAEKFFYVHRGTKTLAFRLPPNKKLLKLLKQTGPLVATSANPEGLPPALTIRTAKKYFGKNVDFYVDGGKIARPASTLISLSKFGKISVKRR